jgi:hypothetical protein
MLMQFREFVDKSRKTKKRQKSKNKTKNLKTKKTNVGSIYPIGIVIDVRSPTALANIDINEPPPKIGVVDESDKKSRVQLMCELAPTHYHRRRATLKLRLPFSSLSIQSYFSYRKSMSTINNQTIKVSGRVQHSTRQKKKN